MLTPGNAFSYYSHKDGLKQGAEGEAEDCYSGVGVWKETELVGVDEKKDEQYRLQDKL